VEALDGEGKELGDVGLVRGPSERESFRGAVHVSRGGGDALAGVDEVEPLGALDLERERRVVWDGEVEKVSRYSS
jgi:hypothetical protein